MTTETENITPQADETPAVEPEAKSTDGEEKAPVEEKAPAEEKVPVKEQKPEEKSLLTKGEEKAPAEPYVLDVPEGVVVSEEVSKEYSEFVNANGVSKEAAEGFMKKYSEVQAKEVQDLHQEWRDAALADTEFGGPKFEENMGFAKQALSKFGGDKLIEVLNQTGMGNHPEIIRTFYRVGKALGEGQVMTKVDKAPEPTTFVQAVQNLTNERKG